MFSEKSNKETQNRPRNRKRKTRTVGTRDHDNRYKTRTVAQALKMSKKKLKYGVQCSAHQTRPLLIFLLLFLLLFFDLHGGDRWLTRQRWHRWHLWHGWHGWQRRHLWHRWHGWHLRHGWHGRQRWRRGRVLLVPFLQWLPFPDARAHGQQHHERAGDTPDDSPDRAGSRRQRRRSRWSRRRVPTRRRRRNDLTHVTRVVAGVGAILLKGKHAGARGLERVVLLAAVATGGAGHAVAAAVR